MSKLKPIKDEAELARVPLEEPVLVELEPAGTGADVAAAKPEDDDEPPARDDDTGAEDIAAQLRAAQDATAAERRAREAAEAEAARLRAVSVDTEKELLTSSLEKAQNERDAAKAAYKQAYEAGDPDAMADANDKIGRAAAQIVHFEGAIANFGEGERPAPKQDAPVDVLTAIDRDPQLLPSEKEWLKKHPETLVQGSALNAELTVAHNRALAAGHARGTDAYFKSVDKFLGFDKSSGRSDNQERAPAVAAPVSRDSRSFGGQPLKPSQIQLTPEERQMARNLGQSETTYARNKLLLQQRKQSDPERYATTR